MFNVIAIMYIGEITIPNYKGNTSAAALIGSETSRALLGNYDKPTDRQTNGQTEVTLPIPTIKGMVPKKAFLFYIRHG